ncbi:hypothetical protein [Hymenobacter sp. GOD-10R]|uniref:hypothetical protein n=1 Tax=Hymenobacter sp. GOD-10R TaxID=3093922 RepID=UPI002D79B0DE|nr:hypothetical protein [Hymenobacter sp. GOD-10R]WRQ27710.1 hypothetical protein SD425_21805 [Hymenobacter sp. GOD-10R]
MAPLLLLPFVENAFRRGSDAHAECSWVSLDLVVKQNSLTFKVINSQSNTESDASPDLGLSSIRQRLQLLYPHQHELKVVSEPDTLLLVLHVQLTHALPPALTELARTSYPLTTTL